MLGWILAVLALFVVQTLIAPALRYYWPADRRTRLRIALGPRDAPPPMPIHGARADRALKNMFEALPVFLTLALLIHIEDRANPVAHTGAAVFLAARIIYVPCYVFGLFGVRSAVWAVGHIGLLAMLAALLL